MPFTKEGPTYEYKNISLGKITAVDIKNPLRILLFTNTITPLFFECNQLNEIQKKLTFLNSIALYLSVKQESLLKMSTLDL
jgi:hypothetical protein